FSADPKYCAGKFPVASDPGGAIARSFRLQVMAAKPGAKDTRGAEIDHAFTERTTFVIAPGGKISAVFSSADDQIAPSDHAVKSLTAAQKLTGKKPR
ncbi:MAG: peroxiredoxin, partial [Myxococcota bacterium]